MRGKRNEKETQKHIKSPSGQKIKRVFVERKGLLSSGKGWQAGRTLYGKREGVFSKKNHPGRGGDIKRNQWSPSLYRVIKYRETREKMVGEKGSTGKRC